MMHLERDKPLYRGIMMGLLLMAWVGEIAHDGLGWVAPKKQYTAPLFLWHPAKIRHASSIMALQNSGVRFSAASMRYLWRTLSIMCCGPTLLDARDWTPTKSWAGKNDLMGS